MSKRKSQPTETQATLVTDPFQLSELAVKLEQNDADYETIPDEDPEALLASQIAEDQALAQDEAKVAAASEKTSDELPTARSYTSDELQAGIEALLLISEKPLSSNRLRDLLLIDEESAAELDASLAALQTRYQRPEFGIEIAHIAGGYQFRTKPSQGDVLKRFTKIQTQRLSSGAMETLAIIAYKQPLLKEEVDAIRGVDSSYFLKGLLDRSLIEIAGRSDLPGRPMVYQTSTRFLELFGLAALDSLPPLQEVERLVPASVVQGAQGRPGDGDDLDESLEKDPRVREMRRLVSQMGADKSGAIQYDPKEDERLSDEIKARIQSIPTSTPTLQAQDVAEKDLDAP